MALPHYYSDPITPGNLFPLIEMLNQLRSEEKGVRVYFRGERDVDSQTTSVHYPLQPLLLRKTVYDLLAHNWDIESLKRPDDTPDDDPALSLEAKIFERYKRYTAHLIEEHGEFAGRSLQNLEILCMAQHHGLPTMLLDWSLNPFVALYFAIASDIASAPTSRGVSRLWVMILKKERDRRDRTVHLEQTQHKHPHDHIVNLETGFEEPLWDADTGESYAPQFRRSELKGWQWFKRAPHVVVPLVFTKRIAAQSGRFVYCSNLDGPNDRLDKLVSIHFSHSKDRWKSLEQEGSGVFESPNLDQSLGKFDCVGAHRDRLQRSHSWVDSLTSPHRKEKALKSLYGGIDKAEYEVYETPWARLFCYPIGETARLRRTENNDAKRMKEKMSFLTLLDTVGFHAGNLFPDLTGWAKYISQGYK